MYCICWQGLPVWTNFKTYEQAEQFIDYYDLENAYEILKK